MKLRKNEDPFNPIRWPVFYETRQGYFFMTREGVDFGPYKYLETVKYGRQLFIYQITGDPMYKPQSINAINRLQIESVEMLVAVENIA